LSWFEIGYDVTESLNQVLKVQETFTPITTGGSSFSIQNFVMNPMWQLFIN
jgi:hypothetical protein